MKKNFLYCFLLCMLAIPVVFVSCGDNTDEPENGNSEWNSKILGSWKWDLHEVLYETQGESGNSKTYLEYISLNFIDETDVKVCFCILTSNPGGFLEETIPIDYKYSMNGNHILFTNSKTNEVSEMIYDIQGNHLRLTYKDGSKFPVLYLINSEDCIYSGPSTATYTRQEEEN